VEKMYKNIVKGEYCPREKPHICIGDSCGEYGNPGCGIYFRSSNNSRKVEE